MMASNQKNLVSVPCSFDVGWQTRAEGRNSHTCNAEVMSLSILVKSWMTLHEPRLADSVTMAKIATAATTKNQKITVLHQRQWGLPQLGDV